MNNRVNQQFQSRIEIHGLVRFTNNQLFRIDTVLANKTKISICFFHINQIVRRPAERVALGPDGSSPGH